MFSPSKENNREDHLRKGAEVSPWESVVAGSMSGAVSRAITAPLDTVKIRLQIQTANIGNYNGVWKTSKSILRNEGIKAFWKGNVPAEIMYILYGAVQFTSYTAISKMLTTFQKNNKSLSLSPAIHSLVVGAGAGITSTIVTYPFDLLRTRLAANRHRKILSMIETIKSIKEADGISGFFIGIRPALLSVASNTGLMFWTYELAREFTSKYNGIPFIEGICGFIAGATAKGITFPLDTLRKRIQVKSLENSNHLYKLSKQIIQQEGLFGLYKGYGISVFKTAPTSALSIFIYEYTISMVRKV